MTPQHPTWQLRQGWGRTPKSLSRTFVVEGPDKEAQLHRFLSDPHEYDTVLPRGLGRSYGDAALNGGGFLTDPSNWCDTFEFDRAHRTLTVSSGFSLDEIMARLIPAGFFVPVTPGTRYVSVGGAIAADIHGKNHHRDGSFGQHVTSLRLVSPKGISELTPSDALFWASVGGMGLTGLVSQATISVQAIETSQMKVVTSAPSNIEATLNALKERDPLHQYSVAWVDCSAKGRNLGRSVITWGDHATLDDLPNKTTEPLSFHHDIRLHAPDIAPSWLLNNLSVRAFNEAWYRRGKLNEGEHLESIPQFFHPLDAVGDWNRLYGPKGFLQYQFVVPFAKEGAMVSIIERLSSSHFPSFLAVLKRFGPSSGGYLSFPSEGWTLALDLPAHREGLTDLLDSCDEIVADAGGRVYLAKDSRVSPHLIPHMYPRLSDFRDLCDQVDPAGRLTSDISRRLNLRSSTPSPRETLPHLIAKTQKGPNR